MGALVPKRLDLTPRFGSDFQVPLSMDWFTIWLFNIAMENPLKMEVLLGKSSINGPFSIAMLNNQMVRENRNRNPLYFMGKSMFFCPRKPIH